MLSSALWPVLLCAAAGLAAVPVVLRCIRPWVANRCAVLVTAGSTGLCAGAGWFFAGDPALAAWCWLAITSTGLVVIDLDCHRLPHLWVMAMAAGGLAVFTAVTVAGYGHGLIRALAAPLLVFVAGVALQWLVPGQMGFGDTTLYSALSVYWGWIGWHAVITGIVSGIFLLGAIAGIAWITGVRGRTSRIAAGPALIAGGWIGVLT